MVTGDSQEEVLIFVTNKQNCIIIYISSSSQPPSQYSSICSQGNSLHFCFAFLFISLPHRGSSEFSQNLQDRKKVVHMHWDPPRILEPFGKKIPTLRETDSSEPLSRSLHYYHLEQQDFHNDRGLKRPNAPLAGLVKRSWVIGSWFPHPTIPLPNTLYYR